MIKTRRRVGDAASMVAIELVVKSSDAAAQQSNPPAGAKAGPAAPKS
jgi:hypothetical protein